ncbi:MAG: hypothetical protein H8E31_12730 [Planctomycetes bacterium]|nr:hypothetical protein [Planctomycetota bacterium]
MTRDRRLDRVPRSRAGGGPCGLCGKSGQLTRTECCGQWICDDEGSYRLFSYARNSCSRNHRRRTLCGYHHAEGHAGRWQDCRACAAEFETELYVYYGTNEYNFEVLPDPPEYQATRCAGCGATISLGEDGYSKLGPEYRCLACADAELQRLLARPEDGEARESAQ